MDTLSAIEKTWEKHMPDSIYELHFLDDSLDSLYMSEKRMQSIAGYFAFFAIAISCLGLFGLATFSSQQRIKEIGIRKVLGAKVSGLVLLLTKDFSKWVTLANLIAWPVAWIAMDRWLQNFAYRIDLTIWPFMVAGLLALGIALLTVGWHAVRAATADPVDSLRYE